MKSKNILVTGGCGFIGSNLVKELKRLGHEIVVIDDLSSDTTPTHYPEVKYIHKSLCDKSFCDNLMPNFDYVFHLAASARIQQSISFGIVSKEELENEYKVLTNNINSTLNLLNFLVKGNLPKRVIYSSSSSIYGDNPLPFLESMVPKPKNSYAISKYVGELCMKTHARFFDCVTLRYFNVFGPHEPMFGKYATVIGKFIKQVKEGKPTTPIGNGEQKRSFTYVDDVVAANIMAMNYDGQFGGDVFNIGTSVNYSINELSDIIGGKDWPKTYLPERLFEAKETLAYCGKAKEVFGWEPKVTLEEGIKRFREHLDKEEK